MVVQNEQHPDSTDDTNDFVGLLKNEKSFYFWRSECLYYHSLLANTSGSVEGRRNGS